MKSVLRFKDFRPAETDVTPIEFVLNSMGIFESQNFSKADLIDMVASQSGAHEGIFDIAVHCYFRLKFPELASVIGVATSLSRARSSLSASEYADLVDFIIDPTSIVLDSTETVEPPAVAASGTEKKFFFESDKSLGNKAFVMPRALYRISMLANPALTNSVIVLKATRGEVLRAGIFDNEAHNLIAAPRRRQSLYVYTKPYTSSSAFEQFVAKLNTDPDFEFGRPKVIVVDEVTYDLTLKALPNLRDYNDLIA